MREVVGLIARLADGQDKACLTDRSVTDIKIQIEELMGDLTC